MPGQLAVLSVPSLSLASSPTIAQLSVPIIQAAERHFTWINHHFHHQSQHHLKYYHQWWFEIFNRIFPEIFRHSQPKPSSQSCSKLDSRVSSGFQSQGAFYGCFLLCWCGEKVQLVGAQACVTDRGDRCRMMWCGQQVGLCHWEMSHTVCSASS